MVLAGLPPPRGGGAEGVSRGGAAGSRAGARLRLARDDPACPPAGAWACPTVPSLAVADSPWSSLVVPAPL
eukprot:11169774-Lingulodinium_polyedra.AAC.1